MPHERRYAESEIMPNRDSNASHHCNATPGEHPRGAFAQQDLQLLVEEKSHASSPGMLLITCRTSMGMLSGLPPGPGADEASAAISIARCSLSTSTIQ
jgi:hypothetical protein